jgi:hypothetical protein
MIKAPNLISFKAALERFCFKRDRLYELIREGKVIAYKDGRRTLVDADSLAAFQASLPRLELPPD